MGESKGACQTCFEEGHKRIGVAKFICSNCATYYCNRCAKHYEYTCIMCEPHLKRL